MEDEGGEAPGVGAIEIVVLCLAVGDKDGDEEGDEAPGVGAIEINVLGLTVGDKDGDEEVEEEEGDEAPGVGADAVGVGATGVDDGEVGALLSEGADVIDMLGVAPVNVTFLTTYASA